MNSEKVKEIEKALENCQKNNCLDCPYFIIDEKRCRENDFLSDTISLLRQAITELDECMEAMKDRISELEKKNAKLNIELDKRDCIDYPCRLIEKEHLKQFAERLKENFRKNNLESGIWFINVSIADETLKEFIND